MRKLFLTAIAAALLAAAPAYAADTSCVRQDDIRNWNALNDKHIVLENYHHQKVLLTLIGTCANFKFSDALEIRSPGAIGLSCVATGDTIVTHSGIPGRCSVVSVAPYPVPGKVLDPSPDQKNY